MSTLKEHKKKNCMVNNCNELGKFYNPDSKMVYCELCKIKLGGKIIYQKADLKNGIFEKSQRLLIIPVNTIPFNIMEV